jgi:hypothetical protein
MSKEEIKEKIRELIDNEMYRGENSDEITELLFKFLLDYAKANPDADFYELKAELADMYNPDEYTDIIRRVREETLNEGKLIEKGVIISASFARDIAARAQDEFVALEYSGLSKLKISVLEQIKKAANSGFLYVFIDVSYDNGLAENYYERVELVEWLEKLGFEVNSKGYGKYEVFF